MPPSLSGALPGLDAFLGVGRGAGEADGFVAGFQDVAVVHEPIEQRRGHLRIDEHAGPLAEVQVGRDHHAGVLVEAREQVEEQRSAGLAKGQVAQLVEDDQVEPKQTRRDPPRLALRLLLLQRVDQIDRRVKAHPLAVVSDAGYPDRRGQVRLAGTGVPLFSMQ